jgi:hypothetical protein
VTGVDEEHNVLRCDSGSDLLKEQVGAYPKGGWVVPGRIVRHEISRSVRVILQSVAGKIHVDHVVWLSAVSDPSDIVIDPPASRLTIHQQTDVILSKESTLRRLYESGEQLGVPTGKVEALPRGERRIA